MIDQVWIAVEHTADLEVTVQPAATREAALAWLVSRIDEQEWRHFLAALARNGDESAGTPPEKSGGDPRAVLEFWWGPAEQPEPADGSLAFGAGTDNHVSVARMPVLPADG